MMAEQVNNVPSLRFPDFDGEWGKYALLELCEGKLTNGVFNDPKKVGSGYRVINVKDMYVGDFIDVNTLTLLDLDGREFSKNKVNYGDLFFTRSSIVKEGIAYSNVCLSHDDDITYDGHLIRMRPRQDIALPQFLAYFFTTSLARKQLIRRGKTTTMTTIGQEDIASVYIVAPQKDEQQKIADFLTAVDKRIEQLEEKKRLLTEYKKGVMRKIFSQQIRFTDDNGNPYPDWKEKRLGDVAKVYQPKTISQTELTQEGYDVYGANGIIGKYDKYNHEFEQVAITCRGNTCGVVNFTKAKSWITGNAMVINLDKSLLAIKSFMYFQFSSTDFRYLITGSGQPQITGDIKKHKVLLPSIAEQQKIADFLTAIDNKIEQVGAQLEQAKAFKKGLLQQMFV